MLQDVDAEFRPAQGKSASPAALNIIINSFLEYAECLSRDDLTGCSVPLLKQSKPMEGGDVEMMDDDVMGYDEDEVGYISPQGVAAPHDALPPGVSSELPLVQGHPEHLGGPPQQQEAVGHTAIPAVAGSMLPPQVSVVL